MSSSVHAARRDALRAELEKQSLDALLVTDLTNIRYLTGFTGSNAVLLVGRQTETVFATDDRYAGQSAQEVPDLERVLTRKTVREMLDRAERTTLGFESHVVTVDAYDAMLSHAEGIVFIQVSELVENLRMIKDDTEVDALRRACAIADGALAALVENGAIRPGRTEREIAHALESEMFLRGSEAPSFDTIVAAGEHSAMPHHRPTNTALAAGDLLKLDFGATVDGYHSDMTRMLVLGTPAQWQRDLHELVYTAQEAGVTALAAGAKLSEVDKAARDVIADGGHGDEFRHGLGHGVGLDVHEPPMLHKAADGTLSAGMTVTVEPGVYLAGRGGVRIEDTVAVGADGYEVLTRAPKDLVSV